MGVLRCEVNRSNSDPDRRVWGEFCTVVEQAVGGVCVSGGVLP